jgi:hypothetical protein
MKALGDRGRFGETCLLYRRQASLEMIAEPCEWRCDALSVQAVSLGRWENMLLPGANSFNRASGSKPNKIAPGAGRLCNCSGLRHSSRRGVPGPCRACVPKPRSCSNERESSGVPHRRRRPGSRSTGMDARWMRASVPFLDSMRRAVLRVVSRAVGRRLRQRLGEVWSNRTNCCRDSP